MNRDRIFRIIIIFIILLLSYATVHSQDYRFSVPQVEMDVTVLPDAAAVIQYTMHFENAAGAHAIDIVDVGLPNDEYNIAEMEASLDGVRATSIAPSQYVKPGVEVHLGTHAIAAGNSGTFRFQATVRNLVFQDTTRKDYASFQITPTWFDGKFVQGLSDTRIRIILPEGIAPEEVVWHDVPFTSKEVLENRIVLGWQQERSFTGPSRVGVSFPKKVMTRIVTMSTSQLMMRWWRSTFSVKMRGWIAIFSAVVLAVIYFRFTGGTGGCLLIPVLIFGVILFIKHDIMEIYIWPALLLLGVIVETSRRRRKAKYLPAIASVEGGGIKRGLTAPEAALVLELPINKVVTLILFGMVKKGLIRQTKSEPPAFQLETNPEAEVIAHTYEKQVLKRLRTTSLIHKIDFGPTIENMIESVAKKMKDFDLEETRAYYKHIISRAWIEARTIGNVETWQKKMDEKIDWMMLDPDFGDRFRPYSTQYRFPSYRTGSSAGLPSGKGSAGGEGTKFSDVAASVSGWLQNTSSNVVAKIEGQQGGIVNLGAMDKALSKAMASSGSGGGGGGGGCACACAGCACACACAGGGR